MFSQRGGSLFGIGKLYGNMRIQTDLIYSLTNSLPVKPFFTNFLLETKINSIGREDFHKSEELERIMTFSDNFIANNY